jgi:hypothetical protein
VANPQNIPKLHALTGEHRRQFGMTMLVYLLSHMGNLPGSAIFASCHKPIVNAKFGIACHGCASHRSGDLLVDGEGGRLKA